MITDIKIFDSILLMLLKTDTEPELRTYLDMFTEQELMQIINYLFDSDNLPRKELIQLIVNLCIYKPNS